MINFIHGDNAPLQIKYQEIISEIKAANPSIVEKYFDGSQKEDEEKFYETISINSIFAPKELIVFKRSEQLKNIDNFIFSIEKYDTSQKEIVITYEEVPFEYGDKIANEIKKKTIDKIQSLAKVTCYRKKSEKAAAHLLIQKELNISQGEADELIEIIGDDYFKIVNEVEKIKNFLEGDRYNLKTVLPLLSVSREFTFGKLIDQFLAQRKNKDLLEYLQKEREYMGFLYILGENLINYLKINSLIEEKIITKNIGHDNFKNNFPSFSHLFRKSNGQESHYYQIFLLIKHSMRFDVKFLQKKLEELLLAEYNVKSGNMEEEIAVEAFILNFFNEKDLV
ncbi:hypothetical protein [Fusobacterium sp. PH5-44]|uniref:hypothetical protein n=1 Tax=unclassified Fusobacterium TaxID=2648384 RepID=UPI003D196F43